MDDYTIYKLFYVCSRVWSVLFSLSSFRYICVSREANNLIVMMTTFNLENLLTDMFRGYIRHNQCELTRMYKEAI